MTPALRTHHCAITVASLLLLATPVAYAEESEAPELTPAAATPAVSSSLAGRPAGEGRPRPGRTPEKHRTHASQDRDEPGEADREDRPGRRPSESPSPSVSASQSASAAPSRTRPSQRKPPPAEDEELTTGEQEEAEASASPAPIPSAPAAARQQAPQALPQPVAQQISPMSLGIGMALMGLGIGFLGVRLRRR
ncbi:hypothetical protein [Streptomyces sp. NBC_01481]|uniref:hypothetical protein n=1 Tax=Streptomyces sp. NBC_01481 TaxID=2975869 RepID=UPI002252874A|nr:hypothetical protein [Streptomyces sp. NBC_01481]MCX4584021.1 hypothetical protein [Streptomyces sp. NBC_01481]